MFMQEFLIVAGIHLLAVMSPGPDFAMVMRNSLVYSRRTGVLAAVGLALGIMLHVTYSLLGIGLIISQSVVLFNILKLVGAAYLIYIGVKSLLSKKVHPGDVLVKENNRQDLSAVSAIRLGFLTNALNPKATLFFLALFTQVINQARRLRSNCFMVPKCPLPHSPGLTQKRVSNLFSGIKYHIEKAFGAVLVALGIKVALGSRQ
jgi:threonine/homoserine/homoserine lactone efflux protein